MLLMPTMPLEISASNCTEITRNHNDKCTTNKQLASKFFILLTKYADAIAAVMKQLDTIIPANALDVFASSSGFGIPFMKRQGWC